MRHVLGVILLFILGSANAALIDYGTYTEDDDTGLKWLDLSATAGLSMTEALAANDGWRLANNTEVNDLFYKLFDGFYANSTSKPGVSDSRRLNVYADHAEDAAAFQSLFGITYVNTDLNFQYSYGLYFDENNIVKNMGVFESLNSLTYTEIFGPETGGSYSVDYAAPAFATYLVQGEGLPNIPPVPIPAAVWLFGSGLGLLGWFRRKKA